jgi:hypothetical protein
LGRDRGEGERQEVTSLSPATISKYSGLYSWGEIKLGAASSSLRMPGTKRSVSTSPPTCFAFDGLHGVGVWVGERQARERREREREEVTSPSPSTISKYTRLCWGGVIKSPSGGAPHWTCRVGRERKQVMSPFPPTKGEAREKTGYEPCSLHAPPYAVGYVGGGDQVALGSDGVLEGWQLRSDPGG